MRHVAFFLKAMEGGGAERVTASLASALSAGGRRVDLVLGSARGPMLEEVAPSVRVVDLRAGPGIRAVASLLRLPREARPVLPGALLRDRPRVAAALPGLARYLRRERPDALISAMAWNNLVAIWARELAATEATLLVCEHTTLSEQVANATKPHIRQLPPLVRAFYGRADVVAAVSGGAAADLAELAGLPRERVITLYNPVDLERIASLAREPCDHPWLAPGAPPVVLAVGRLKPEKDYPTLLRAFDRVRAARPARLLVLGEGVERAALERMVHALGLGGAVQMPGFAANPYAYMARAGALALSSTWEGLPTVIAEALACGCPVVATDCRSGPRELLDDGAWGRLVPVGDADALAQALLETLAAPRSRHELVTGALRFSVGRCTDAYLGALEGARKACRPA